MEEQKNNPSVKEVVMDTNKKTTKERQPSYEELDKVCGELYMQNRAMQEKLKAMQEVVMYKRVEYLFKVIELSQKESTFSFNKEFVQNCIEELEEALTPKDAKKEETIKEK